MLGRAPREPARSHRHHQPSPRGDELPNRFRGTRVEASRVPDQSHPDGSERVTERPSSPDRSAVHEESGRHSDPERLADVHGRRPSRQIGDPDGGLGMDHKVKTVVTGKGVSGKANFGGEWLARPQDRLEPGGGQAVRGACQVLTVHPPARKEQLHLAVPLGCGRSRGETNLGRNH